MSRYIALFIIQWIMVLTAQAAGVCSKSSPVYTVALLELYSSEGCSSCPPADQLVQHLYAGTGLTSDQVIPLALHVDYWDYIGWKDPYGKPMHTERQNVLSALAGSHSVYTPEFFMAGREFRPGRADLRSAVLDINRRPAQASIQIQMNRIHAGQLELQVDASSQQDGTVYTALVENGLVSRVNAGENSGSTLQHDAVLREWGAAVQLGANVANRQTVHLAVPVNSVPTNLSVVAFVQNPQGKILQALSMPMCHQ